MSVSAISLELKALILAHETLVPYLNQNERFILSKTNKHLYYAILPFRVHDVHIRLNGVFSFDTLLKRNANIIHSCRRMSIDCFRTYGKTALHMPGHFGQLSNSMLSDVAVALGSIFNLLSRTLRLQHFSWKLPQLTQEEILLEEPIWHIWKSLSLLEPSLRELHLYTSEFEGSGQVLRFLTPLTTFSFPSLCKFTLEGILSVITSEFLNALLKAVSFVSELRLNLHVNSSGLVHVETEMPNLLKLQACFPCTNRNSRVCIVLEARNLESLAVDNVHFGNKCSNNSVKSLSLLNVNSINGGFGTVNDISVFFPNLRSLEVPAHNPQFRADFLDASLQGLSERLRCIKLDLFLDDFSDYFDPNLAQFLRELPNVVEISLKINSKRAYKLHDLELLLSSLCDNENLLAMHITQDYGLHTFPLTYRFNNFRRIPENFLYVMFTTWPSLTTEKTIYRVERMPDFVYLVQTGMQHLPGRTPETTTYGTSIAPMVKCYWEDDDIFDHLSEDPDYLMQFYPCPVLSSRLSHSTGIGTSS